MSSRWKVASRIAHRELVPWMSADYSSNQINVYMLRSQAGRIRLGKHRRSEMYRGCVDFEKISGLMMHRQQRGGVLQ
jgi:hypothetical protein